MQIISARDVWRIFLIYLTFAVWMLAAGVAIQRDILPSSVEWDVHEHPAFVKHDGNGGYMLEGATFQFTGTGYTRTSDESPSSPFGSRPKSLMNEPIAPQAPLRGAHNRAVIRIRDGSRPQRTTRTLGVGRGQSEGRGPLSHAGYRRAKGERYANVYEKARFVWPSATAFP